MAHPGLTSQSLSQLVVLCVSVSGSPSPDELSLELERAKLRNDPGLLAVANKLVQDVLRKAREEALRRIKHDTGIGSQVRKYVPAQGWEI